MLRAAENTIAQRDRTITKQGRRISELVHRIDSLDKILMELGWNKECLEYAAAQMERGDNSAREVVEDVESRSHAEE